MNRGKKKQNKNITLVDIQYEVSQQKIQIKNLKLAQIELQKEIFDIKTRSLKGKEESHDFSPDNNFLLLLSKVTSRKWIINISIKIDNKFILNTTALFDTCANLNCIKEGLIPTKYFEKTIKSLKSA